MCIRAVLDASAFRHMCVNGRRTAGNQILVWLRRGDGKLVYTEKSRLYSKELNRYQQMVAILSDLRQSGQADLIEGDRFDEEYERIPLPPLRRSDDPHVLALAAAADATVLISCDTKLHDDFKNKDVLPNVGRSQRAVFPLIINDPNDTSKAKQRASFLRSRRCSTL